MLSSSFFFFLNLNLTFQPITDFFSLFSKAFSAFSVVHSLFLPSLLSCPISRPICQGFTVSTGFFSVTNILLQGGLFMGCSSFTKYSYCFSERASTGCSVGNCSDMVLSVKIFEHNFSEHNFRPWQSYRERRQALSPQSFRLFEWLHSTGPFC